LLPQNTISKGEGKLFLSLLPADRPKVSIGIKKNEFLWCGARLSASKSNAVNLILRLFLYHFLHMLVTSQVHPQQHKQPTNTTTIVMEPLDPPAEWI
jgi:hypothetical protein